MQADHETSGRCALAAIEALSREIERLPLSGEQGRRLAALARMTREHVGELMTSDGGIDGATERASPIDAAWRGAEPMRSASLTSAASEAWAAASALRRAEPGDDRPMLVDRLRSLAMTTSNGRLRRLCLDPLPQPAAAG